MRAVALLLIIEGLLPTLMPQAWRATLAKLSESDASQLRIMGIISIAAGALLFHFLK